MMPLWQQLAVGALLAFLAGALFVYAVFRLRRRAGSKRDPEHDAMKQAAQELRVGLHSQLASAIKSVEQLNRSRRLGAEERELAAAILDALNTSVQRLTAALQLARLESDAAARAKEPFDLHGLVSDLVSSMMGVGRNRPARIRVRIDPRLPYRLMGDPASVRTALTALCASLARPGGSVLIDVKASGRQGGDIVVRFQVAHAAASGNGDLPRQDDIRIAERIATLLGGKLDRRQPDGRGGTLSFQAPFSIESGAPGAIADIASARVLLVTRQDASRERLAGALAAADIRLMTVATADEAITALGRAIRLGDPLHAIIVEKGGESAGPDDAAELCEKAGSVQTPVYLASEGGQEPDADEKQCYTAVLNLAGPADVIAQAIHAGVCAQRARLSGPFVQVEPWAWRAGGARPRRRILVVDDNVTNLLIVENILRSAGYDVDAARSGEEALTRLLAGSYRLAILDLHMPGMDGVTLLKRYRALRPRIKIPIAFLTANTSMEATRECSDAGADAFLTKPIVLEDLLNTVETLLKDNEVHWLPGVLGRGIEESEAVSPPSLVDREVIRGLSQIYRDDARGVGRVIETFRTEAEGLLDGMALAASTNDAATFRDHAHALWASAVNVGAAALAAACRDAKTAGPVELRRDGAAMVAKLRDIFDATVAAFGDLVEASAV